MRDALILIRRREAMMRASVRQECECAIYDDDELKRRSERVIDAADMRDARRYFDARARALKSWAHDHFARRHITSASVRNARC